MTGPSELREWVLNRRTPQHQWHVALQPSSLPGSESVRVVEAAPVGAEIERLREALQLAAGDLGRAALVAKLDDMQLHDNTGDPRDEGYMAAVNELRAWLEDDSETKPASGTPAAGNGSAFVMPLDGEMMGTLEVLGSAGIPELLGTFVDTATREEITGSLHRLQAKGLVEQTATCAWRPR